MPKNDKRIFLSPPHMSGEERTLVTECFDTNYLAGVGPMIDQFEKEFCELTGHTDAAALTSGTAAMHLALRLAGIGEGDEVWTSTLTFIGGVSPIMYQQASPVFLDVDPDTWTLSPQLLEDELKRAAAENKLPKAIVPVDIYGQCADLDAIRALAATYEIPVILDSAESVGATYKGRHAGKGADVAIYSFNGNKLITTAGGGMIASDDPGIIQQARYLSTQAREPSNHYEHVTFGYNYRMPSVCAAIGIGQLGVLSDRVAKARETFAHYEAELSDLPGISFMPEAATGKANRWLTVMMLGAAASVEPMEICEALGARNIEARPVWKPMHLQPVFRTARHVGGEVSEELFQRGVCLPSGTDLTPEDLTRVIDIIKSVLTGAK